MIDVAQIAAALNTRAGNFRVGYHLMAHHVVLADFFLCGLLLRKTRRLQGHHIKSGSKRLDRRWKWPIDSGFFRSFINRLCLLALSVP